MLRFDITAVKFYT